MRNQFENNESGEQELEASGLGEKLHMILPPLNKGWHYRLEDLPSGSTAIIVEND